MKFIVGQLREQMVLVSTCLDDLVAVDNEVRIIDLFVSGLNLKEFGFRLNFVENGRPAYRPSDLLKLSFDGIARKRSGRCFDPPCKSPGASLSEALA